MQKQSSVRLFRHARLSPPVLPIPVKQSEDSFENTTNTEHVHSGAVLDINTHCSTPNKGLLALVEVVTCMKLPTIKHAPMPVFPKVFLIEDPFWARELNTDRPCSRQYSVRMHPKSKFYFSELILYIRVY